MRQKDAKRPPLVDLAPGTEKTRREAALKWAATSSDNAYVVPLLDLLRHAETAEEWYLALDALTPLIGENARQIEKPWRTIWDRRLVDPNRSEPPEGYREFRIELLARTVDPAFRRLLDVKHPSTIPIEGIQWGGVGVDGIPALEDPTAVTAAEATFLEAEERVFGITIGDEARAYPGRILDWHEMANDVIGGVPVSLTWCTLCGAPIAYRAERDGKRLRFGSSGLLYASNKLMFDRATETLWNQLTGRPVLGPRVASQDTEPLQLIQVRTTTWDAWRREYPHTTVISTETGHDRDYTPGAAYRDYFVSPKTMFPVARGGDEGFSPKQPIVVAYGPAGPSAVATASLRSAGVLRRGSGPDAVTFVHLRTASEAGDGTATFKGGLEFLDAAAFATGELDFRQTGSRELTDDDGKVWLVTPQALVRPGTKERFEAISSHAAFGFTWGAHLHHLAPAPPAKAETDSMPRPQR